MVRKLSVGWACLGLIALSLSASAQVRINTRSNLIGATLNQPYSNTLIAAGGVGPYTFTLTLGTPPTGITLSSAGLLSGTPTVAGPMTFSVKVTDANGVSSTKSFTLDVQAALQFVTLSADSVPAGSATPSSPSPQPASLALPSGQVGQLYTSTPSFNMIGGISPYATSVISGQMPPGLRVGAAGDGLHGTPTTAGTYNFTLRAYDSEGRSATGAFTVTILPVAPLAITSPASFNTNVGADFQQYLSASGGYVPYMWRADPASLPQGLSLTAGGSLEGEPTNPTSTTFAVTVTDGSGATATQNVTVNVFGGEGLQITTTALTGAVQNVPYSDTVFVSGVVDSGTMFSIIGGTLPSGQLSFSGGNLHGTITAPPGLYTVTIQAVDYYFTATKTLNLSVYGSPLTITTPGNGSTLSLAIARPDDFPLAANAVFPNPISVTFDLLSGSLPEGITIGQLPVSGAPVLSGTPNGAPGTYHAVLRARTDGGLVATQAITLVVAPPTAFQLVPGLPDLLLGADYLFVGANGTPDIPIRSGDTIFPNYFRVTAGALPPGIVLESFNNSPIPVGALVGTPTATGIFNFTVTVTDASGATKSQAYTVQVIPQLDPIGFSTPTVLPEVVVGINYAQQITATGGGPPYTYSQDGGILPPGYAVNSSGIIFGPQLTASSVGTYTFTVEAFDNTAPVDGGPLSGFKQFMLRVVPAFTTVNTLPNATSGTPYNATIQVSGGTPPYTFSQDLEPDALPAGLTLNPNTGQITGTTTMVGSYQVGITIHDSGGSGIDQVYSLTVTATALSITTASLPDATMDANYNLTVAATGGVPPYTFSATGLPAGLSISSGGVITGMCNTQTSSPVTLKVIDSTSERTSATAGPFTVGCNPAPVITNASPLPNGTPNVPYSVQFTTNALFHPPGAAPFTWTIAPGAVLPAGFTLSPTGVLTGTATTATTATFSIIFTDRWGASTTKTFTINFAAPVSLTSTSPLPPGRTGTPYTYTFTHSGGLAPFVFSSNLAGGWETLNPSTGVLSGTPLIPGTYIFSVTITDAQNPASTDTKTYQVVIQGPQITTTSPLPPATIGVPFSYTLTATGGTPPYTWSGGELPSWITLSSAGVLSGTPPPNAPTSFSVPATVTDSVGANASATIVLPIGSAPLTITTVSPLTPATVGQPYTTTLMASGGTPAYAFSAVGLPSWLTLTSAGVLSGTPPGAGPITFTLNVSDQADGFATRMFTLPVNALLTIDTPAALPPATVGMAYTATLTASGGTGGYTWAATGLPAWLTLSPAGVLTGTAPTSGPVMFTATVTDSSSHMASRMFTLPVDATLVIGTATPLPAATVGIPYTATFTASGGSGTYTWSAAGLPAWLMLTTGGVLTGTPPTSGPVALAVTVTDSLQNVATKNVTLPVNAALVIGGSATLPAATVGSVYSYNFTASGGTGGYVWSGSGLPAWLTLTPAGFLTGTPPAPGPVSFAVTVTDSSSASVSRTVTLPVSASLTIGNASPLPPGTVGAPYSLQFTASGGSGSGYSWMASGLPTWLTLTPAGLLTGTPPIAGSVMFSVVLMDSAENTVTAIFTLPVFAPLTITTAPGLPAATVGVPYSFQLAAAGGSGSYTWSGTGLPAWLSLSPAGLLTGTPTSPGPVTFTATVNGSVSQAFGIVVNAGLTITSTSLPAATVGVPYSAQLTASGGSGTYTWTASGLPAWLTLSPSGSLTGTPPSAGPVTFTATVNGSVSQMFTLQVNSALTIGTTSPLPAATVGVAYSQQFVASGGSGSYTWSASGLPAWLTLSPAGLLTGTPPAAGPVTFTVTVNGSVSQTFTLPVNAPLTITTTSPLPAATVGVAYSQQFVATGGSGTYTWSATGLPAWLTLTPAGLLTGTPPSAGPATFTVTVNGSVSQTFTLPVNAGLTITTTSPLPAATVGVAYLQQFVASGGSGTYTWSATGLPAWLTLSPAGLLTGTPPSAGPVTFTVTVNGSVSQTFTLPVNSGLTITTTSPLPAATVGVAYSQQFVASGGSGTYTWSATGLPAWLTLSPAGLLSGTAPTAGPVTFTATVNGSVSQTFTLPVNAGLTIGNTSPLPAATVGVAYSQQFVASGGSGTYSWSATGLPTWLTLTTTGLLTGTPPAAGPVTFTATVNGSVSQAFTLPVNSALTIGTTTPLSPATVGMPYSLQFTASGGTGSYTWSASGLPAWLTLTPAGLLTGTPPTAGPVTFTATANESVSQAFTLPVNSALTIGTTTPLSPATVGMPYTLQFTASGGTGSYTWSASGLPTWLTLTTAGLLTGTPPTAGPVTFTATVNDSVSQAYTLPVNSALTIGTTTPLSPATVGMPYSLQFTASGGTGSYTWSATGLPAWLTLTSAGLLTGTPPTAGPVTFTATVNGSVSQDFTLPVNSALTIGTTTPLSPATVGMPYSLQFTASGGTGSYTWSASGLPTWLTLTSAGLLTGTPPTAGPVTFTATVNGSVSKTFTLPVIASLAITSSLNPATVGVPYAAQLTASGGSGSYTWSATGLPAWLTLTSTGFITGLPPFVGSVTFTATVNGTVSQPLTLQITGPPHGLLAILSATLPNGTVGQRYSVALYATGAMPPYSWSVVSGSLPNGLSLDSTTGGITGTPTAPGTSNFSVQASGGSQTSPAVAFAITVIQAFPLSIASPSQLPAGAVGTTYSQRLTAVGGSGAYSWVVSGGALPTGLTLAADGTISGLPSAAQSFSFGATVTDSAHNSAVQQFQITISTPGSPIITSFSPLSDGVVAQSYQAALSASGGTPPYTWSILRGNVPDGLSFDSTTGTLSGTPTKVSSYQFTVTVSDLNANSASRDYTINILDPAALHVLTNHLTDGLIGTQYALPFAATGGTPPYRWQLGAGPLPAGISLTPDGNLSGVPSTPGTYPVSVQAVDAAGQTATASFSLNIADTATPQIIGTLASVATGKAYAQGLSAIGGQSPYSWSIAAGGLPPGLSLDPASGAVTGTPSQKGPYMFTARVADSAQASTTRQFNVSVYSDDLTITPSPLPNGATQVPYSSGCAVTGGTAPYNWSLNSGGLLSGLSLNPSTGLINGTPTQTGSAQFTVTVTDSAFDRASQSCNLTVQGTQLTIDTTQTNLETAVGATFTQTISVSQGAKPLVFSIASGTLPPGLSLDSATGTISGAATTEGTYNFTIQVKDAAGSVAVKPFTIKVSALPLQIVTASLPPATAGVPYSQQLQSSGGLTAVTWSLSGSAPQGLSLDPASGILSGTPATAGTFPVSVQITDGAGNQASRVFQLQVGVPVLPNLKLSGVPAKSNAGGQPTASLDLDAGYPLPLNGTATLQITPDLTGGTDLGFDNGSRTLAFTIPANATHFDLPFNAGTLAGTIQLGLTVQSFSATATTVIDPAPPTISAVSVASVAGGFQVTITGWSTTRDMKTAMFQFTPAGSAQLGSTSATVDVGSIFTQWYQDPKSFATGSRFSLMVPFSITGDPKSISALSVTLTNSAGSSAAASASVQ